MKKLHRAWKVCIGCAILFFCTSGLVTNAFSIYLPYILSLDGFTNTRISTLLTVRSLAGFIALFATGLYYRVLSLKKGMLLSMIMVAAGFMVYGFAGPNYPLYLLGALLTGFGYGFGLGPGSDSGSGSEPGRASVHRLRDPSRCGALPHGGSRQHLSRLSCDSEHCLQPRYEPVRPFPQQRRWRSASAEPVWQPSALAV